MSGKRILKFPHCVCPIRLPRSVHTEVEYSPSKSGFSQQYWHFGNVIWQPLCSSNCIFGTATYHFSSSPSFFLGHFATQQPLLKCCFPFSECHLTRKALTRPALGANLMKRDLDWPNLIPFMKHCSLVLTADWPGQLEPKLCPTILLATRRPRPQKNPKRTWLSLFWTHFGLWLLPSFNKEPTYSQGDYGFQNTV